MQLDLARYPARVWRGVVDLLTPSQCLACHVPLDEPASLCVACWSKLNHIDDPVCNVMGTPFAYDQGMYAVSAAALADPPSWDRSRAAVAFDEASRPLVHALKYRDTQEAGLLMARMMARAGRELIAGADVIIPVPLYRWRLWKRRFNQSGFLAQQIGRLSGKPYRPGLLVRQRATRTQVGLNQSERRRNVRGAFLVPPESSAIIAGKTVLLVDDVRTTGATLDACARTLMDSGAAQVDVLSFALVLEPTRLHI